MAPAASHRRPSFEACDLRRFGLLLAPVALGRLFNILWKTFGLGLLGKLGRSVGSLGRPLGDFGDASGWLQGDFGLPFGGFWIPLGPLLEAFGRSLGNSGFYLGPLWRQECGKGDFLELKVFRMENHRFRRSEWPSGGQNDNKGAK